MILNELASQEKDIYKCCAAGNTIGIELLISFSSGRTRKGGQYYFTSKKIFQSEAVLATRNTISQPS